MRGRKLVKKFKTDKTEGKLMPKIIYLTSHKTPFSFYKFSASKWRQCHKLALKEKGLYFCIPALKITTKHTFPSEFFLGTKNTSYSTAEFLKGLFSVLHTVNFSLL